MQLQEFLKKVADFQKATDQPVAEKPTLTWMFTDSLLRYDLMHEENKEYIVACQNRDLVEVLDAVVDQLYILSGTINTHGLGDVLEEAFNRVHENNLTKIGPDGKVLRNPSGKILKPSGFVPVSLDDLVKE